MGQSVVVLGAQWGDEGKGKIVDLLTEEIGAVVRFGAATMQATPGHQRQEDRPAPDPVGHPA